MSLRVRLEGAWETLEQFTSACDGLREQLVAGWRSSQQQEISREWLDAALGFSEQLPKAYAKVAALRDRVSRAEQRQLDGLAAAATKAGKKLDERVDEVLLVNAAEMVVGLEHKLKRLSLLLAPHELQFDEGEVWSDRARLARIVPGRWGRRRSKLRGSDDKKGTLTLTTERVLYEDGSRRLELPVATLETDVPEDSLTFTSRDELFGAELDDGRCLGWCLALMRNFSVRGTRPALRVADVPVLRVGDYTPGRLLAWQGGAIFFPDGDGLMRLRASLVRHMLVSPDHAAARRAIVALLPWLGDALLKLIERSSWNWAWRRPVIVLEDDDVTGDLYLRHRSKSFDEPTYAIDAEHAKECRAALGPPPK